MREAPCKNCMTRNIYCHARCDKYSEWASENKAVRNFVFKENKRTIWSNTNDRLGRLAKRKTLNK